MHLLHHACSETNYLDLKTFFPVWNNKRPYGINCSGRIFFNQFIKYLVGANVLINSISLLKSSSLSKSGLLIQHVLVTENLPFFFNRSSYFPISHTAPFYIVAAEEVTLLETRPKILFQLQTDALSTSFRTLDVF